MTPTIHAGVNTLPTTEPISSAVWRYTGAQIDGNPYSDGRWRFDTYDFDYTAGLSYEANAFNGGQGYDYDSFNRLQKSVMKSVLDNLLKNAEFRQMFVTRCCDMANIPP